MVKKNRQKLKINKVQLINEPEDIQADFGHLNPTLYLELLENKDKVIKELRNKEYIPPTMPELRKDSDDNNKRTSEQSDNEQSKNEQTDNERTDNERKSKSKRKSAKNSPEIIFLDNKKDKVKDFISKSSSKKELKEKLRDSEPSINVKKSKYDIDLNDAINRMKPKLSDITSKNRVLLEKLKNESDRESRKSKDRESRRDNDRESRRDDHESRKSKDRESRRDDRESRRDNDDREREKRREERHKEERRREREKRRGIDKLRDGKSSKKSLEALLSSSSKSYRKEREHYSESEKEKEYVPPKLSEIPSNGSVKVGDKTYRDVTNDKPKENELNLRRELQYKFDILRKKYKGAVIPEFTEFSDLNNMQKTYDMTVRKLNLDSSVENYKKYLIGSFMVLEFLLGTLLKFDMGGFSQQQMLSINSYETLLIELGEKSYIKGGSQFPVELRLLFMIVINAGLFIIGKKITRSIDGKVNNGLGAMFTKQPENTPQPTTAKRPMRGPTMNIFNTEEEKPKAD